MSGVVPIVILAAGQSRRLGQDKAALFLPPLQRAAEATGCPVRIVGRGDLQDDFPGHGPLGGLATALRQARCPVLVAACDMPGLDTEAFLWLLAEWESCAKKPVGLVVGQESAGYLEPLFAIYAPPCLPRVLSLLEQGRRSLHGLLATGDFLFVDAPEALRPKLRHVHTPEELAAYSTRKP